MGFLSSIGKVVGLVGTVTGNPILSGIGALSGALDSASAAKDAASIQAAGANSANALQAQIYNQNRQDMLPWLNQGTGAINRLGYLLGTAPITAADVSKQLGFNQASQTPVMSRARIPGSDSYNQYGPGTEYLVDGSWTQWEPGDPKNVLSPENQAKVDAEIARQKADPNYGSLVRPFSMSDFQKDPGYDFRMSEGQKAIDRSAAAKGGLLSGAAIKAADRFNQDYASNEFQNAYNRYNTNQTNIYNRLAGISGSGQTTSDNLATVGQNYANNAGTNIQNAADYRASGNVAQQNILSTGLSSLGNIFNQGSSGGKF